MLSAPRAPLRPSDPRRLGAYWLDSRLGEGGMGAVYLGHDRDGRPVAIKIIKPEYAHEEQFRARFRSEVNRARQVPPFCTAELLDADADHETPYLVVEYVDGPSLAEVVAEQGPLTAGNLYSVAVGVATALAAIHGAGVIHRDLKPRNVLFALGTPKVIDFGIARAFEATSQHTGTDQMVGTVAYMAPERFDTDAGRITGPAADVFAWGVVVAYAGTGRTPFAGDSAAETAARILTQPPNLDGVPEPLRDLVARTLQKDPARRPSAVELLDLLLAAGAQEAPAAGDLASRPELRKVAQAAQRSAAPGARPGTPPSALPGTQPGTPLGAPPGAPPGSNRAARRLAVPALAIAAIVVVAAAGLLAFPPGRQLLGLDPQAGSTGLSATTTPGGAPLGGAAPSVSPSDVAAPSQRATAAPSAGAGRDDGAPVVVPATAAPRPVRLCRSSDTSVTITAQSDDPTAIGTQKGLVSVVNTSGASCRVDGRVYIGLYNAADERVDVPTRSVEQPGRAIDMVLRPGGGAFQGIKWQACDRDDADCPVGNTVRGSLEASAAGQVATLEGFPDPARSDITMRSLQLGTLQPSAQGTVAW